MKVFKNIVMSDQPTRKGDVFPLETIMSAYRKIWCYGTPMHLGHDYSKPIGWNKPVGIYFQNNQSYLVNNSNLPENEEEQKIITKADKDYLIETLYEKKKEQYDELQKKLEKYLTKEAKPVLLNAVAYHDSDLVLRVFPDICELLDDDNLIAINELNPIAPGIFSKDEYLLFVHPYFRRNCCPINSLNTDFLKKLQDLSKINSEVKIALDLDCIGLLGTEKIELEYQYWWGPKFNDDLLNIPNGITRHVTEERDKILTNIQFTEFNWYDQDGEKTFVCEEVIDLSNIKKEEELYGCRYVHSRINSEGKPYHLDGSIRIYSTEKICERLDKNIDEIEKSDCDYLKLWRIDNEISVTIWKELFTHYFRDNYQVGEYLGGKDLNYEKILEGEKNPTIKTDKNEFLAYEITENSGLYGFIKIHDKYLDFEDYDVIIQIDEFYQNKNNKFLDLNCISLIKKINTQINKMQIPDYLILSFNDDILNLPTFVCRDYQKAYKVLSVFSDFCTLWNKEKNKKLISFSMEILYDEEIIAFSFIGYINNYIQLFSEIGPQLETEDKCIEWLVSLYKKDKDLFNSENSIHLLKYLQNDFRLTIRRNIVSEKYIEVREDGVYLKFNEEEKEEIEKKRLSVKPVIVINNVICSKCNGDYKKCKCISETDKSGINISEQLFTSFIWARG